MTSEDINKNNLENKEIPKISQENTDEKEISQEEFLNWLDNEGNLFKEETTNELGKINSVDLDQPTFEKVKNETGIENDLNTINQDAGQIINEAKDSISKLHEKMEQLMAEKRDIFSRDISVEDMALVNQRIDQISKDQEELSEQISRKQINSKSIVEKFDQEKNENEANESAQLLETSQRNYQILQEMKKNSTNLDFSPEASRKRKQLDIDSQASNINVNEKGEIVDFTEERMKNIDSISQLYRELDNIGGIQGSHTFYSSKDLKEGIQLFLNDKIDASFFTNTYGFRDKVIELKSDNEKWKQYSSIGIEKLTKEELYVDRIEHAVDMRDLVSRIISRGDITAPDGYVYKKDDIITNIVNLKDINDPNLQKITNTYGLRDKVKELLQKRGKEDNP